MKLRWMLMTKSEHDKQGAEVYDWIKRLQTDRDNEQLKEKIVIHYNDLVESLARKYSYNRSHHEDLVQVGMIGLLLAVERFDEDFGRAFEAFAVPTIIGEIKRYIRDKTWSVHVPRRIKELGPKINRAVDELSAQLQSSPTIHQIASHLNVSEEDVLETMEMSNSYRALSADRPVEIGSDGSTISIFDIVGDSEDGYEQVDTYILLERLLPILDEREQRILKYLFFDQLSQKEVAEIIGISQMHVSRLQRQSLQRLRDAYEAEIYRMTNE